MSIGHKLALGLLLLLCVVARVIALDADPPQWLSWSMGLQTDEGFYTLDARHEALFGTWAPGNFHDRLLSPLLSLLQQAVFHGVGVGTVQARGLSVTFGLLTLAVFWFGLRLKFDDQVAAWGTLLLGLAPPVVFYNRMALQETPTVFWLVLAFTLWAATGKTDDKNGRIALLTLSGVCFSLALVFKPLAIIALPTFLVLWWPTKSRWGVLGMGLVLTLYLLLWYVPHHAELARMGSYYQTHQFMPHSARSVWLNFRRGFIDGDRGVVPYLLRLLTIPCLFALAGIWRRSVPGDSVLALWLLAGLTFCLLSSYAPDRYYVLFYPALAGLAALGAVRLPRGMQISGLILFLATSGYWCGLAWVKRDYARRDAAQALVRALPTGSVLVGEMAPALGLDTPFPTAPVQPGLSNDEQPVARLQATHVLVTRVPNQKRWWHAHDPTVVLHSHLRMTLPLEDRNGDVVDIYAVNE